ncbi:MAG TPA: N-(5'-phosphoribosyl)anthranilate isomerase [Ruminococcus sp.]|nr:N-(5'-phosphoribosyl)anthranilate isomerase [Ruminococcus sp.]
MSIALKICGNRRVQDVQYLNQYKPDYAGFILSGGFGRSIVMGTFYELKSYLDNNIQTVGVFVNEPLDEIIKYAYHEELNVIQLHGEEDKIYIQALREVFQGEIWKAVRVRTAEDIANADKLPVDRLVLDSFSAISQGGTGTLAPWDIITNNRPTKPFFLAGGISAENAVDAVKAVNPFGIDVSSSVETDKCKDPEKIRVLTETIKNFQKEG